MLGYDQSSSWFEKKKGGQKEVKRGWWKVKLVSVNHEESNKLNQRQLLLESDSTGDELHN